MSDDKSDKAWGLLGNPLPIVMVALLAAGVLVKYTPLESARPTDPERVTFVPAGQQDVEARLWQDPFAAVEKHKKSSEQAVTLQKDILIMLFAPTNSNTSSASHRLKNLKNDIKRLHKKPYDVTVVAVSVFGGPYAEDAESRRRSRFAVVSALGFHNYHPQANDAIGYFPIGLRTPESNAGEPTMPFDIPYEWFEKEDGARFVLVLWLMDEKLTNKPLTRLHDLFNELMPDSHEGLTVKFIGPAGSGTLRDLVHEGTIPNQKSITLKSGGAIEFYSPSATISNCDLFTQKDSQPQRNCFKNPPSLLEKTTLPIVRTTGTDDVLSTALLWELWQRGVNRQLGYVDPLWERKWPTLKKWFGQDDTQSPRKCEDGLVLIGERDTRYGRTLLGYLTQGFADRCGSENQVRILSYLRGLDGMLADADKSGNKAPPKNDSGKSKDLLDQLDDAPLEHAEGRSQLDYLHRLADEIDRLDDNKSFAEHGVKAIGVVGSDLYDKLLILQALRSRFKNKIFFTTDLDARYLHADQKKWTRNLVVASNFGLSLKHGNDEHTLPFRDSYQTATYLATLMALDNKPFSHWDNMKDRLHPRIFEIGRTEAVYLASPSVPRLKNWIEKYYSEDSIPPAPKTTCNYGWLSCISIEPDRPPDGHLLDHPIILSMICFGILFFALADRRVNETVRAVFCASSPKRKRAWARIGMAVIIVAIVMSIILAVDNLMRHALEQGVGKPYLWLEGVSLWPSLVVHSVGLLTMCALWYRLHCGLRSQKTFISRDFKLARPSTPELERSRWSATLIGPHLKLVSFCKHGKAVEKKHTRVTTLWKNYLRATSFYEKKYWIAFSLLIGIIFIFATVMAQHKPGFLYRGQLIEILYNLLVGINALVLWLSIFWVGYETRVCTRFVEALRGVPNEWPDTLLKRTNDETGVAPDQLENYLDFQLIVRATQRIEWLIYLPFVSLFFMMLAGSHFFGALDFSLAQVFPIGLALTYALYHAWLLNKSAKKMRGRAINYYKDKRSRLGPPSLNTEPFDRLIRRINNTHEGAFAYVAQQPALQALLMPFGGYGSVQLIEYLFKL